MKSLFSESVLKASPILVFLSGKSPSRKYFKSLLHSVHGRSGTGGFLEIEPFLCKIFDNCQSSFYDRMIDSDQLKKEVYLLCVWRKQFAASLLKASLAGRSDELTCPLFPRTSVLFPKRYCVRLSVVSDLLFHYSLRAISLRNKKSINACHSRTASANSAELRKKCK